VRFTSAVNNGALRTIPVAQAVADRTANAQATLPSCCISG
jgi:hypothetical protein